MKKSLFQKIVLGSEVFSGSWGISFSQKKVDKIINRAYDLKIREIDTAPSYGKNIHDVEKMLGKSLCGNRSKFIINTKFSNNIIGKSLIKKNLRIYNLYKSLDNSLKCLKTDYIDNFFFHSGSNSEFFNDDIWDNLILLKKQGVIKNLGVSIRHNLVKKNKIEQIKYYNKYNITKVSTVLNMCSKESLRHLIPFCKKNNLFIYSRMPLAKGLLSGKYKNGHKFSKDDPRFKTRVINERIFKFLEKNKEINAKIAISWALEHSDKSIVSFKNVDQINNLL